MLSRSRGRPAWAARVPVKSNNEGENAPLEWVLLSTSKPRPSPDTTMSLNLINASKLIPGDPVVVLYRSMIKVTPAHTPEIASSNRALSGSSLRPPDGCRPVHTISPSQADHPPRSPTSLPPGSCFWGSLPPPPGHYLSISNPPPPGTPQSPLHLRPRHPPRHRPERDPPPLQQELPRQRRPRP